MSWNNSANVPAPEISPIPAYYSNFNHRDHVERERQAQQEHLIPRKAVPGPQVTTQVRETKSFTESSNDSGNNVSLAGHEWIPGFWGHIPYHGIIPLLLALGCVFGSIGVLVQSDGAPVTEWKISPTVYLAALTTIQNLLTRFAFNQGYKIAWWRKALQGGSVSHLASVWNSGDGFWGAVLSGRHFSLVSLGSIAATLIVIDQPLIQRASTIVSQQTEYPTAITAAIAREIPYGYTSYQNGRGTYEQVMTQPMISAFNGYNSQSPMDIGFTGCNDTCDGHVDAGGVAAQCSVVTGPIQYTQALIYDTYTTPDGSYDTSLTSPDSPFNVTFKFMSSSSANSSHIIMDVGYTELSTNRCSGIRTQKSCILSPATISYPVTIRNNTLTLKNISTATVQEFQPPSNISDCCGDYTRYTIGGLFLAADNLFNSNATYRFGGAIGTQMTLPDTLSNQFLMIQPKANKSEYPEIPRGCNSNWSDPTTHILTALNEIAFRVSLTASDFPYRNTSTAPGPQNIIMRAKGAQNVYQSEYKWLIASTVLSVVFIALIVPTFNGWWELGRSVSLNPIETAKAFDAPLLRGPGSNAPIRELTALMGRREVRFGEVEEFGDGSGMVRRRLRMGGEEVGVPRRGVIYE